MGNFSGDDKKAEKNKKLLVKNSPKALVIFLYIYYNIIYIYNYAHFFGSREEIKNNGE